MGLLNKLAQVHLAMTENIKLIDGSDSINAIKNSAYKDYVLKPKRYEIFSKDNMTGIWGLFGYRTINENLKFPAIYFIEIYAYKDLVNHHPNVLLLAWRYTSSDQLDKSKCYIHELTNTTWHEARDMLMSSGIKFNNEGHIIGTKCTSYQEVHQLVKDKQARMKH